MSIVFHESSKTFHLFNKEVSYIINVLANGGIENLYYGKAVRDRESFAHHHEEMGRSHMAVCVPEPGILSRHYVRDEYPSYGTGDFRSPAYTVLQENGSRVSEYKYSSHTIIQGKPSLAPLPSTYVENESDAETLEITLVDSVTNTEMMLSYTIYADYPIITRHTRFKHRGEKPIVLHRALSFAVDFLDMNYEMIQFSGAWARERYMKKRKLEMGIQSVGTATGTGSGADHTPFIALSRPETTESSGEVYGFSLVYSGNFLAQVEVSTHDMTRVMLGIHPESFSWKLENGESFVTPEAVLVYSNNGYNAMSQALHDLYRNHLMQGEWKSKPRPILLNNWEATYFDFNEEKLLKIASKAKEVGVELFVLDDGWFGARNDDYRGLGDWFVNTKKLPSGVTGLADKVEAMGLKFGIWVELEMVNKDSNLYRNHPDWLIGTPERFECHSRHQHVLDMTRDDVVDYLYDCMDKLLSGAKISYIKWDMNRYMTEPFGRELPADRQGEFMHRYILGVYKLYDKLTKKFPHVLFESCASGGARFDGGILHYAPQTWTSDDTDANERTKIQYGTSYMYPVVSMGSHVSAVPNHQMHRNTPISTRAAVAYFGTFGYELDLNLLSDEEIEAVKSQVKFMKEHRELIQMKGDFYRILSPFEHNDTAWAVVAKDKSEAVAMYYQRLNKINASFLRFKLLGLCPDAHYKITYEIAGKPKSLKAYGDELMYLGIPVDREDLNAMGGDFAAIIYIIKKIG